MYPACSPDSKSLGLLLNPHSITKPKFEHFQVYKIRWFMLFLLVMCSVCTSMQYVQYTIIADVVADFYGISYEAVDWSIMIMMLFYILFNFLGIYVIEKIGIKKSVVIAMVGATVATLIKVGSVSPDRYWVALIGQAMVSVSQVLLLPLPAHFASAWFGENQVALACGMGVSGIQLGVAIGFVIPPMMVKASEDKGVVAYNMLLMNIGFAVMCTVFLLMTFFFLKPAPSTPPSRAQKQLVEVHTMPFKESTKCLFSNVSYIILLATFSINGGIYNTLPALLNQIILHYYSDGAESAGKIGLVMLLIGIFGATVIGYVMDKLQRFKMTTVIAYAFHLLAMVLFSLSLTHSITAVYIGALILGFCMSGTYSIGLQVAAELTYPVPESSSSGYLLVSAEITGILFIYMYSFIFYNMGPLWANGTMCVLLLLSTLLIICTPFNLRRQAAQSKMSEVINRDSAGQI